MQYVRLKLTRSVGYNLCDRVKFDCIVSVFIQMATQKFTQSIQGTMVVIVSISVFSCCGCFLHRDKFKLKHKV